MGPSGVGVRGAARRRVVALAVFGAVQLVVGSLVILAVMPEGAAFAAWWPVAGIGAAVLLRSAARDRPAVLVVHGAVVLVLAAFLLRLPAAGAVIMAAAHVLEILVVVRVLEARGRVGPRFQGLADLARAVAAICTGAAVVAGVGGVLAWLADVLQVAGGGPPPVATAASLFASHTSAMLLVLPLAMEGRPVPAEASGRERIAQVLVVGVATLAVFAPDQHLPLLFLLVPPVFWGVLRAGLRDVAGQICLVAAVSVVSTVHGGGPFHPSAPGVVTTEADAVVLVQLFLVTTAGVLLAAWLVVQDRRASARQVAARERRAEMLFSHGLIGMLDLRPDERGLRVVDANEPAVRILGPGRLPGAVWGELFTPAVRDLLESAARGLLEGGEECWRGELQLDEPLGGRWVSVMLFRAPAEAGGTLLTAQLLDVTDQRRDLSRLRDLALRDPLTGALNHAGVDQALTDALDGTAGACAVLFCDLDDFKDVNDRFGHRTGDEVLRIVATRLALTVRSGDQVGRLGGDEFVVVCRDVADRAEVEALRERLEVAVGAPMSVGGRTLVVPVSVGIALGAHDREALLHEADEAMYRRKRRGR